MRLPQKILRERTYELLATSQSLPNLDFVGLTVQVCVMQTDVTVSYNDLRESHRRLANALREAKEREEKLMSRIHFLTLTLGEAQIGVFPCSPEMADA